MVRDPLVVLAEPPRVVAPGTHDTASAVMAAPAASPPGGRDADMLSKEDGLGGIVVTDRRVIYRKQRKRGEFKLDDYAALIAREEEGLLAIWHETEYERTRMGRLRPEQWDSLRKQLKDAPNLNILRR